MTTQIDRLEIRLTELGIKPAEFARRMNMSPQTFNGWKVRGTIPGAHIFKAAEVAECDPLWLSKGEGEEPAAAFTSGEHAFDYDLYESVLSDVIQTMKEIGLELEMKKIARIAYICYNQKVSDKPATRKDVVSYLHLAS